MNPYRRHKVKSLGYRTDFFFNEFDGSIEDKGFYIVARTDSNPNYFWGNLLLFKNPPKKGDLKHWKSAFKKEFLNPQIYHMTFAWDSPEGEEGDCHEFINEGFELEKSIVLTAHEVHIPRKFNNELEIKIIESNREFEQCVQFQIACASDKLSKASWEDFYKKSMIQYRKMIDANKGLWFGAVLNDQIVGSLGVFSDGEVGRFQIVSTDPNFQRQGVCSTLVYKSAKYALKELKLKMLVMVADENYHAAKIYESIGFRPTEKQIGLCWWDKKKIQLK